MAKPIRALELHYPMIQFIVMRNSKHELSTINMLYSLKQIVILHSSLSITATSPQRPLSSVPKVAVVERFDCILEQKKKV